MKIIAAHASVAIENIQLQEKLIHLAATDPLTGLLNRRAFLAALGEEIQRLRRRYLERMAIVFLDVDDLKRVNDQLGHSVGDQYLQHMAKAMREHLRQIDRFGRLGGDEFGMVLPQISPYDVVDVLRRIRDTWRRRLPERLRSLANFSAGGWVLSEEDTLNLKGEDILAHADQALLRAKSEGKGAVFLVNGVWASL